MILSRSSAFDVVHFKRFGKHFSDLLRMDWGQLARSVSYFEEWVLILGRTDNPAVVPGRKLGVHPELAVCAKLR